MFGFGEGRIQSCHWFGQVFLPLLLQVLRSGYQFGQHICGMNRIEVVEGLGVAVERSNSVVSLFGANPLVAIRGSNLLPRQLSDTFQQCFQLHLVFFSFG